MTESLWKLPARFVFILYVCVMFGRTSGEHWILTCGCKRFEFRWMNTGVFVSLAMPFYPKIRGKNLSHTHAHTNILVLFGVHPYIHSITTLYDSVAAEEVCSMCTVPQGFWIRCCVFFFFLGWYQRRTLCVWKKRSEFRFGKSDFHFYSTNVPSFRWNMYTGKHLI